LFIQGPNTDVVTFIQGVSAGMTFLFIVVQTTDIVLGCLY